MVLLLSLSFRISLPHISSLSGCICVRVCPSKFPPFIKIPVIGLGAHPTLEWPHLNYLYLPWPYLQIRSHSEVLGLELQNINLGIGDTIQPITYAYRFVSVGICMYHTVHAIGFWGFLKSVGIRCKKKNFMQWTVLISFLTCLESEIALSQCINAWTILRGSSFLSLRPYEDSFGSLVFSPDAFHVRWLCVCVHDCVQGFAKPITVGNSCLAGN